MSDIIQRLTSLISSNSNQVGTSPGQISGGMGPLVSVASGFYPSYHRQVLRVINNSSTASIYLGSTSLVSATGYWFKELAPGQMVELSISGSVPVWMIATASSTSFTVEELA